MALVDTLPGLSPEEGLSEIALDRALEGMILSASGWRGVFAPPEAGSENGEESAREDISPAHRLIAVAVAAVFGDYVKARAGQTAPEIIVARDTRPTGEALARTLIRTLLSLGCDVRFAGIAAAPEIMAYARAREKIRPGGHVGFVYISASHNPIGHNGFKFGLSDGSVLQAAETEKLIGAFRAFMAAPDRIARAKALLDRELPSLEGVYENSPLIKVEALAAYREFTHVVLGGREEGKPDIFEALVRGVRERPLGVAADFNGSARTLSIDRDFLTSLGLKFYAINDSPGEIMHRIVPEGESLEPCRFLVEELHLEDPAYLLGYVPDCDGDRGNMVIWDQRERRGRILEAQEVFALVCVAELAWMVWTGELGYDNRGNALDKVALAVNDPTSFRVDRIARAFDVSVFRAEVGEANVVGLARKLREKGYKVRVLGEGSAGGAIIHPRAVRDPIDSLGAILKLLCVRSVGGKMGLFEIWCDLSDQAETYREDFSLSDIIASLPAFVTTGAYTPEAKLWIKTSDHALLKERYQEIFLRDWEERKAGLKSRYGISDWLAAAYNGTEEKTGLRRFGEAGRGGLKISFINGEARKIGCIWMRGSATEPVFRVMADAEGQDKRMERDLIEWQRRMVAEADERD